jgi:hypothetical protein
MRSSLKKKLVLVLLATVALLGWMALQSQPAQAEEFCANYFGKPCWTEGQEFFCYNTGCPWWAIWDGSCSCQEGRWSCTPEHSCLGDASLGGGDTALVAQSPALPSGGGECSEAVVSSSSPQGANSAPVPRV